MNNKNLDGGRTLTTFYSVIAQLVYMYGYFCGIEEFFSRSPIILHIYITFGEIVFYLDTYLRVKK